MTKQIVKVQNTSLQKKKRQDLQDCLLFTVLYVQICYCVFRPNYCTAHVSEMAALFLAYRQPNWQPVCIIRANYTCRNRVQCEEHWNHRYYNGYYFVFAILPSLMNYIRTTNWTTSYYKIYPRMSTDMSHAHDPQHDMKSYDTTWYGIW